MAMFENEVAVDNTMRRFESISKPAVGGLLEGAGTVIEATSLVTGKLEIGLIARTVGIAKKFTSGLGVATLEENIDHLGNATELAITRVERKLEAEGIRIAEIERRIASPGLDEGIAAAILQAQHTNQKKRLDRMARILANGVAEDDLEPESLDDMLRAAVELKEADIILLGKLYTSQNRPFLLQVRQGQDPTKWHGDIQSVWREFVNSGALNPQEHLRYRSSLARLESAGLIQHVDDAGMYGVGLDCYALLLEGKKFYERLQEIGRTK